MSKNSPIVKAVIERVGNRDYVARSDNFFGSGTSPRAAVKALEAEMEGKVLPSKGGRPAVQIDPDKVARMARQGMEIVSIAAVVGIEPESLHRRMKQDPRLRKALEKGRGEGVELASGVLYKRAMAGDAKALSAYLKWATRNRKPDPLDQYE